MHTSQVSKYQLYLPFGTSQVAFFVCFRSTAEETVYVGIMRSIGHAIGGLLSWGINTAVLSKGMCTMTFCLPKYIILIVTKYAHKPNNNQVAELVAIQP